MSKEPEISQQQDSTLAFNDIAQKKPLKQGTEMGVSGEEYIVSLGEDRVYALAPAAYYVWSLCDGARSVEDILKKVESDLKESGEEGLGEPELKQILVLVLSELGSVGLIAWT
ncbi:MAG: PqqD family protein [Sulfolobales archaeon]|nr:PqqD family protein [Sulfolobales archaeon]MDW8083129.1 PqqD family protein [Sulfolobales archaeon]